MRDFWLLVTLTAIWAQAPVFGSPSSLVVMPIVAAFAVWRTSSVREASTASVASLLALVVLWSVAQIVTRERGSPWA